MNLTKKQEIAIFTTIVIIAAILRIYHLGYYSLWMDEVYQVSLQSRGKSIVEVIKLATHQNQPPLDYIIGNILSKYVPFSEFSVRFPAFIFGTGIVAAVFILSRILFNTWTAILSSLLVTFSAQFIYLSQEARPYSIFLFFLVFLLSIFFWIVRKNPKNIWPWCLYTTLIAITLISRGMSPITSILALNIAFLLAMTKSYANNRAFIEPFTVGFLKKLILSAAIAGLFYLPFFLLIWDNSHHYIDESFGTNDRTWTLAEPLWAMLSVHLPNNLGSYTIPTLLGFAIGSYFIFKNREGRPDQKIFLLYAFLDPIISIYLYYFVLDSSALKAKDHYFIQSLIPIFIVSSYGYIKLIEIASIAFTTYGKIALYSTPVVLAPLLAITNITDYYNKPKADYRGAVAYLRTIYTNEDIVVYDTFRNHGSWEPSLYGNQVYFGGEMKVRQYKWDRWVSLLEEGAQKKGKLFLYLHAGTPGQQRFSDSAKFIEKNFEQMTIIYAKDDSLSLKETTILYIDEMLRFFPDTSSKVDLYLAKARLLCEESRESATIYFELAKSYIADQELAFQCTTRAD